MNQRYLSLSSQAFFAGFLFVLFLFPLSTQAQTEECGTVVTAADLAYWQQFEEDFARWKRGDLDARMPDVVPMLITVITRSDGSGGLTRAQLEAAVQTVNDRYAPVNIFFEMCEPQYIASNSLYDYESRTEEDLLMALARDNVMNVFIANSVRAGTSSVCGYTYLPGPGADAVFLNAGCAMNGSTFSHEIGHYLNLYHTHGTTNNGTTDELVNGSNCVSAGDRICDTPADPNLSGEVNGSCNYTGSAKDANGDAFQPNPRNIMSYAPSACRNLFTQGQYDRMRFAFENSRPELFVTPDTTCGELDPSFCLTVTSRNDYGPGSLRAAIRCANEQAGPDTIRFNLSTANLDIEGSFPSLVDDSTVIEGMNLQLGREMNLDARDIDDNTRSLFDLVGRNIEIKDINIDRFLRSSGVGISVGAFEIGPSAEDFLIENVTVSRSLNGVQLVGGYGKIKDCFFEDIRFGIRYDGAITAVEMVGTSILCARNGGVGYQNGDPNSVQNHPDAPQLTSLTTAGMEGTATPNARVEIFENRDGECVGFPCAGFLIGTTTADAQGVWRLESPTRILRSYTATATTFSGDKAYTSDFATCKAQLEAVDFWFYPVPVVGQNLNLELKGTPEPIILSFYNAIGQRAYVHEIDMEDAYILEQIPVGDQLSAGVYVLRMEKGETVYTQKIVIQ
ncbi:MAG: M43 family zinc metalloprotease [Bacteroidota bacterium]